MNTPARVLETEQIKVPQAQDFLPSFVAQQVGKGKTVTYNQGRRLLVARKVKHLVVLQSA